MEREERQKVTDYLSREEIRELTTPSDVQGWIAFATTWGMIAGCFALVAWWPAVWTVALALVILGGRHLALAILMHEASHRVLFRTRALNDFVGEWLCAAPSWNHLHAYRRHHMAHHAHTGTEKDPDTGLVRGFPCSRGSLARKFLRDLTGIAGIKRVIALLAMDFGFIEYTASVDTTKVDVSKRTWTEFLQTGARNFGPVLVTNLGLLWTLRALDHGALYWLWIVSYLTTFSLFVRVRSMAEHACTERSDDDFRNTRTTLAGALARLTVAPHGVNYHLEHHLLMTVPFFKLRRMHELLRARGAYEHAHVAQNYREILRLMVQSSPP